MVKVDINTLNQSDYKDQTYLQLIIRYVDPPLQASEEEVLNTICAKVNVANVTDDVIRRLLQQPIKCNVGISPLVIIPSGCYIIAAHSQRSGERERGILVDHMGEWEPEDETLIATGLRELGEELGLNMMQLFKDNIFDHSLAQLRSPLFDDASNTRTLESITNNISSFISENPDRLPSLYFTILTSVFMDKDDYMLECIKNTNKELKTRAFVYGPAVDLVYHSKDPDDVKYSENNYKNFISNAEEILEKVYEKSTIKTKLKSLIDAVDINKTKGNLHALLKYLIDISENDLAIPIDCRQLANYYTNYLESSNKQERFLQMDLDGKQTVKLFMPSLRNLYGVILGHITSLKQLYSSVIKNEPNQSLYPGGNILYFSMISYNLQRITSDINRLYKRLKDLIYASEWNNGRNLPPNKQAAIELGGIYHLLSTNPNGRLASESIGSHISGTDIQKRINFMELKPGAILYQHVGAWVGNYFTLDPDLTSEQIGISSKVSAKDGTIRDRLKVKFILYKCEGPTLKVALTTAASISDFWSLKGHEPVYCKGGGKQVYIPIDSQQKKLFLKIIRPENIDDTTNRELQDFADNNGINIVNERDISSSIKEPIDFLKDNEAYYAKMTETGRFEQILNYLDLGHPRRARDLIKHCFSNLTHKRTAPETLMLIATLGILNYFLEKNPYSYTDLYEFIKRYNECQKQFSKTQESYVLKILHNTKILAEFFMIKTSSDQQDIRQDLEHFVIKVEEPSLLAIVNLDIGIAYNNLTHDISDEVTYKDFNQDGFFITTPNTMCTTAINFLNKALESQLLPLSEKITCLVELARAHQKIRKNREALDKLLEAKGLLRAQIDDSENEAHKWMIVDREIQLIGIEIGIALNLACLKQKNTLDRIPYELSKCDPVEMIIDIEKTIKDDQAMKIKYILAKWINVNNLFTRGWHKNKNVTRGTGLIALFRKYNPLDLSSIINGLERNTVKELDLSYLGEEIPAGISDADFIKLCDAIENNTSLNALFIRRFSTKTDASSCNRALLLFKALSSAQEQGQKLEYLSYSGLRLIDGDKEGIAAILDYLASNVSLKVLQPSLHDFRLKKDFERFAECLVKHPGLKTLLTGVFKTKDAGSWIYDIFIKHINEGVTISLQDIRIYPGELNRQAPKDRDAIENNNRLLELKDKLNLPHSNESQAKKLRLG